jgi:hypothetical protein
MPRAMTENIEENQGIVIRSGLDRVEQTTWCEK